MIRVFVAVSLLTACVATPPENSIQGPSDGQPICAFPLTTPPGADTLAFATPQTHITLPPLNEDCVGDAFRTVDNPTLTAVCIDGWISYSERRTRTCVGHGGVKRWVNRPSR